MYPGRTVRQSAAPATPSGKDWAPFAFLDCYLCLDCDALAQDGKPLPQGVAQFSVAVREGLL